MMQSLHSSRLRVLTCLPALDLYKPVRYTVLVAAEDLAPGQVIGAEHVRPADGGNLHGYNPITGPFRIPQEVIGRVVALDVPAGATITGENLLPLNHQQQSKRLADFWRIDYSLPDAAR